MSAYGGPVRSRQNIPFKTRRSSTRAKPRGLFGSRGAITDHSKSVKSKRAIQTSSVASLNHCSPQKAESPLWVCHLAAAYAYGIARNHPFVDGNKRTAFVTIELFLELNGWTLNVDDASYIATMEAIAAGSFTETDLAVWVRSHLAHS